MDDPISRRAAIAIVLEYDRRLCKHIGTPEDKEMYAFGRGLLLSIERDLKQLPSAQPERKKGHWKLQKNGNAICSECGFVQVSAWDLDNWDNFCHHCGADMGITASSRWTGAAVRRGGENYERIKCD